MNFNDKLLIYLHHKQTQLENEYENAHNLTRFRSHDEIDYLECIIAKTRKNLCDEIIQDIFSLKGAYKPTTKKN